MVNYNNGRIYKITGGGLDPYIGSTTQALSKRIAKHRVDKKLFELGKRKSCCSSRLLLDFEDCCITLVEEYPCDNNEQLRARERFWFDTYKNINMKRPHITAEESIQKKKENYEKNKDQKLENQKKYNKKRKDQISEYQQKYYEENKDKLKEYNKKNYKDKKEQRDAKKILSF